MYVILVCSICLFIPLNTFGQDLLVTSQGDSINCKIRGKDADGIFYMYLYQDKVQQGYKLHREVAYLEKGFYPERFHGDRRLRADRGALLKLSLQTGPGWQTYRRTPAIPDWLQAHEDALRFGLMGTFDLHFMLNERWGLGGVLHTFRAEHTTHEVEYIFEDGSSTIGDLRDDVRLMAYGFSALYQHTFQDGRSLVFATGSFTQLNYSNKGILLVPLEMQGRTFGARIQGGYEFRFKMGLGVCISTSRVFATMSTITLKGDPIGQNLLGLGIQAADLSRWDLGLGITYTY